MTHRFRVHAIWVALIWTLFLAVLGAVGALVVATARDPAQLAGFDAASWAGAALMAAIAVLFGWLVYVTHRTSIEIVGERELRIRQGGPWRLLRLDDYAAYGYARVRSPLVRFTVLLDREGVVRKRLPPTLARRKELDAWIAQRLPLTTQVPAPIHWRER